jgi:site-specific recombinase XerD
MPKNYHEDIKNKLTLNLRKKLELLPGFISEFYRGVSDTKSPHTKLAYAYDFSVFFNFLIKHIKTFKGKEMKNLSIDDLAKVSIDDLEIYMEYLTNYNANNTYKTNSEKGKMRKLASLRTLFRYFIKKGKLTLNPTDIIDLPSIRSKSIINLDNEEVISLLDQVETGDRLTKTQKKYHILTQKRDLAIISLLLGTGMRISECVGIDISDLNFVNNSVKITRKGGDESILYFNEEVYETLIDYIDERENVEAKTGDEDALFLSLHKKRISIRSIQLLVKKYASLITPLKITPHKLRSTYGTNLYRKSGDIYLVANALGHADVNTTKKHYAKIEEDHRMKASSYVSLRPKP